MLFLAKTEVILFLWAQNRDWLLTTSCTGLKTSRNVVRVGVTWLHKHIMPEI